MRNVCWVGVYCKICKNSLHESWYAKNQICIFLSLHTAAFLGFRNCFLQLCLRPLSLRLLVATVLKFLKPENALISFYSKLSGSYVCIVQFCLYCAVHVQADTHICVLTTSETVYRVLLKMINWMYGWLVDWLTDGLIDWFIHWLIGWLID